MCDSDSTGRQASVTRRTALGAAGSALLMTGAGSAHAGVISAGATAGDGSSAPMPGALRTSRISSGTTLVHADLHNHTLLSDGDGDPALAFASMRGAGLDVAALTDHATLGDNVLGDVLDGLLPPEYRDVAGLTRTGWRRTKELADAANEDGAFTAIRGFEWTEPLLGHVNVWFTEHYTDVLQAGLMAPLFDWLARKPGLLLDGGADGLAGFNHPGREPLRFGGFRYDPRVRDRMVSLEMFNRYDDYLFRGYEQGRRSPLVACLDEGWRTGLSGVTDEHGSDWGHPEGKGRTGMWVEEHSRRGVKAAMLARRFFATRTSGLRVDATATSDGGQPVRMGSALPHESGVVTFALDLARDADWVGRPLACQVLRSGGDVPEVVDVVEFEVGPELRFRVPLAAADGDWVVLRISDPSAPNDTPGPTGHACNDLGIAYTSPWWLNTGGGP